MEYHFSMKPEITQKDQEFIDTIQIMLNSDESNEDSEYHINRWAKWIMPQDGVISCTAHSEGTHGNINGEMPRRGTVNLSTCLSVISKHKINYMKKRNSSAGETFIEKHRKIRKKLIYF